MPTDPLSVHHVGVAVPSIDDALRFYGDKLGLPLKETIELPDRQLRVAFVQTGNMLIELLEPTDPDATVARFLERRGPGLHHLCFGTPDIREHLRDLRDKSVELIDDEPRPGAHGEVAFLQPGAALGVLIELLEPSPSGRGQGEGESLPPTSLPSPDAARRPLPEREAEPDSSQGEGAAEPT
jgi:methylmalonyl-CoA epimerase